jgi:hypothetical protein
MFSGDSGFFVFLAPPKHAAKDTKKEAGGFCSILSTGTAFVSCGMGF